jgi:hypothetical protein
MSGRIVTVALVILAAGCGREREMSDTMEMPDSMPLMRAIQQPAMRDSMLDTMPGGEMVRGDSAAAMRLLHDKMKSGTPH